MVTVEAKGKGYWVCGSAAELALFRTHWPTRYPLADRKADGCVVAGGKRLPDIEAGLAAAGFAPPPRPGGPYLLRRPGARPPKAEEGEEGEEGEGADGPGNDESPRAPDDGNSGGTSGTLGRVTVGGGREPRAPDGGSGGTGVALGGPTVGGGPP